MKSVRDALGVSAVSLMRYGVRPDDDVHTAIKVLDSNAAHLAKLLRSIPNGDRPPNGRPTGG